jgi:hypothetical protein
VPPADPSLVDAGLVDAGLAGADDEHAAIPAVSATQRPSAPASFAGDRIPALLPCHQKLISLNRKVISVIQQCRQIAPMQYGVDPAIQRQFGARQPGGTPPNSVRTG